MKRTLGRLGTGAGIGLYVVWLLAVVALAVTRFLPGPVPALVNWTAVAGAAAMTAFGVIALAYRSPRYVRRLRESLLGQH